MWSAAERARAEEALGRSESRRAPAPLTDTVRTSPILRACFTRRRLLGTYTSASTAPPTARLKATTASSSTTTCDGVPWMAGHVQWRNLGGSRTADILKGWTLSVNDTSTDSHTPEERAALEAAGIKAYICPLLIRNGRFAGAFGIHSRSPRVWTTDEIALVQEVADRMWAALEHRKTEAELRANEERLAFLLRLNDAPAC